MKERRKALLEARLAKVRQRKTIHTVPDLDLDVTTAEGGNSIFHGVYTALKVLETPRKKK